MVEDAIRRVLPEVMNEVLMRTIANSGVIQEARTGVAARPTQPAQPQRKGSLKPSSLSQLLDESVGADFYRGPEDGPYRAPPAPPEESDPPQRAIAQRIQTLPPALQGLAEGIELDDDGGEMWDGQYGDSAVVPTAGMGPPVEKAAAALGLDFSRMAKAINVTEKKTRLDAEDKAAKAQFEQARLKRMRENLNGGKPLE
jgi:hypothetical protein